MRAPSERWIRIAAPRRAAILLLTIVLTGCGDGDSGGGGAVSWCPDITAISSDDRKDRTGRGNTFARVEGVHARYDRALMERCPGVVGSGVGNLKVYEDRGSRPVGRDDEEYVITVFLHGSKFLPSGDLNLEGVRLRFIVTGQFRALFAQ
jgi:hypothetical protein